jgi:hypothetical protein
MQQEVRRLFIADLLTCTFDGVSEGTRTPDTQDHNLVL